MKSKQSAILESRAEIPPNNDLAQQKGQRPKSVISKSIRSTQEATEVDQGSPVVRIRKKAQSNMRLVAIRTLTQTNTMQNDLRTSTGSLEGIKEDPAQAPPTLRELPAEHPVTLLPNKLKQSKRDNIAQKRKEEEEQRILDEQLKKREQQTIKLRQILSEKKRKEDEFKKRKVKIPFSALQSFHATAVVLSYVGYEDQVFLLLQSINKNTYAYFMLHKIQLLGFLVKFKPEIDQAIEFGEPVEEDWDYVYPDEEKLAQLPSFKPNKLKAVNYKIASIHGGLTGIQFVFTDGHKTPLFEVPRAMGRDQLKTIELDTAKTITKIAMTVCEDDPEQGPQISGLRLLDEKGIYVVNVTFMKKEHYGQWVTKPIQKGQAVIGLKGNYSKNMRYISSLGFVLWTPQAEFESPQKMTKQESFLFMSSPMKKMFSV